MKIRLNLSRILMGLILIGIAVVSNSEPKPGETTYLGPFTGPGAELHPDNMKPYMIRYYGTDLGFSYQHGTHLQFLFGDTMATEEGEPIEASTGDTFEDSFGSVDLGEWPDPSIISPGNIPLIKLGQNPGSVEMSAIDPGHAMEGFKTPVGGFSNGSNEYGIFYLSKPQGCRKDTECDSGLTCDTGLGYTGERFSSDIGLTSGCRDGSSPVCKADTMYDAANSPIPGSGFCVDRTSSIWADTDTGRISAMGVKLRIGIRDTTDPRKYSHTIDWLTNKFANIALRTVQDYDPARGSGFNNQNYKPAGESGPGRRVFLWGRPGFIGVSARGRDLGLYFAYVDMPAGPDYSWEPRFYIGMDAQGRPQFNTNEKDAAPVDLDANTPGIQADEIYDVVDHVTIAWVDHLKKWVMFYSGGLINTPYPPTFPNCGVLELFVGNECKDVVIGNGAIRMRTADNPWGPWTTPLDVIAAGDPAVPGSGQYGVGGVLRHPSCITEGCAPHTKARDARDGEYGFFYGANIIEQWITPAGDGVDVIWNASTWDPYRVILFRTRIYP